MNFGMKTTTENQFLIFKLSVQKTNQVKMSQNNKEVIYILHMLQG